VTLQCARPYPRESVSNKFFDGIRDRRGMARGSAEAGGTFVESCEELHLRTKLKPHSDSLLIGFFEVTPRMKKRNSRESSRNVRVAKSIQRLTDAESFVFHAPLSGQGKGLTAEQRPPRVWRVSSYADKIQTRRSHLWSPQRLHKSITDEWDSNNLPVSSGKFLYHLSDHLIHCSARRRIGLVSRRAWPIRREMRLGHREHQKTKKWRTAQFPE